MSTTILKKDSTYGCTHLSIYPDHPPLVYKIIWDLSRTILSQAKPKMDTLPIDFSYKILYSVNL